MLINGSKYEATSCANFFPPHFNQFAKCGKSNSWNYSFKKFMEISVSKLIANRANALKSTGPRSEVGKRRSAANARRDGLSSLIIPDHLDLGGEFYSLVADAGRLGYSEQDARTLMVTLQLGREVIDAKHRAYQDKPESKKVEALTRREWIKGVRDTQIPESQMEEADIRWVGNLMVKQGQQDHDLVSRLGVKIETQRKLMRYEQRAVNQSRMHQKITKRTHRAGLRLGGDKRFYRGLGVQVISCTTITISDVIVNNYLRPQPQSSLHYSYRC